MSNFGLRGVDTWDQSLAATQQCKDAERLDSVEDGDSQSDDFPLFDSSPKSAVSTEDLRPVLAQQLTAATDAKQRELLFVQLLLATEQRLNAVTEQSRTEVRTLEDRVEALEAERRAKGKLIEALYEQLDAVRTSKEDLVSELQTYDELVKKLEDEAAGFRLALSEKDRLISALERETDSDEPMVAERELTALKARLADVQTRHLDFEKQQSRLHSLLEAQTQQLQCEYQSLKSVQKSTDGELKAARERCRALADELEKANCSSGIMTENIRAVREQVRKETSEQLHRLIKENAELQQRVDELECELGSKGASLLDELREDEGNDRMSGDAAGRLTGLWEGDSVEGLVEARDAEIAALRQEVETLKREFDAGSRQLMLDLTHAQRVAAEAKVQLAEALTQHECTLQSFALALKLLPRKLQRSLLPLLGRCKSE